MNTHTITTQQRISCWQAFWDVDTPDDYATGRTEKEAILNLLGKHFDELEIKIEQLPPQTWWVVSCATNTIRVAFDFSHMSQRLPDTLYHAGAVWKLSNTLLDLPRELAAHACGYREYRKAYG